MAIPAPKPIDVRDIVVQRQSMPAAHEGQRPTLAELLANYKIDESKVKPEPAQIGIVDDVLTAGTHYTAMKTILRQRFPSARIVGFFIARRVFQNPFEALQGK